MMKHKHYSTGLIIPVLAALFVFHPDMELLAQVQDQLPSADLASKEEIAEGFFRQQITPLNNRAFYFEVLVPKDWDSRPFEVSKSDIAEAETGKSTVRLALMTPNAAREGPPLIEAHYMRVPQRVTLARFVDVLAQMFGGQIVVRQKGEFNGRTVEDALLKKNVEGVGTALTRVTASRRGEYIFVIASTCTEAQYPKYKKIFGLAAVSFNPSGK